MKKLIGIALVLAVVATMVFGSVALAAEPTEVNITWSGTGVDAGGHPVDYGAGWLAATVTAGDDAVSSFETFGNGIRGSFSAIDTNDNHAGLGVDTNTSGINAEVQNGYIKYWMDRTDSHSYWGSAGQQSLNFVGTDGWGAMATNSETGCGAQVDDCPYPPGTAHHFEVSGASTYEIIKRIQASDGDWAQVRAWEYTSGGGLAQLDCMTSVMWAETLMLGRGSLGPAPAAFYAEGSGSFIAEAHGNSYAEVYATGDNSWGSSASVTIIASWVNGGCSIGDYSMFAE